MSEYIIEIPDYVPPFDPAVRAVSLGEEVVRCRDCKHFATNIHGSYCKKSISTTSDPNGFCAWGERRADHD